jgi:hypothetical protein
MTSIARPGDWGAIDQSRPTDRLVTVVGAFVVTVQGELARMTDLAFDSGGHLFGVDSAETRLYSINLTTGQATVISASAVTNTVGGALAQSH